MMKNYIQFLMAMTEKEIKVRYKNVVLGFLWMFLNPLFQMIVMGYIFGHFVHVETSNYFLFVFTGLLPWNFFSYSLTKTANSIVFERALIQKAKFPRESIPLSIVLSNFFHFVVSISLLIIYLLLVNQWLFINPEKIMTLLISIFWILLSTCGFSLIFSSLNVKYRDVNFFVQALVILWFYATPILYSSEIMPKSQSWIFLINPLTYPIEMFRQSFTGGIIPGPDIMLGNIIISCIVIISGIVVFFRYSKTFSDWL